jgi:hypothetical protein
MIAYFALKMKKNCIICWVSLVLLAGCAPQESQQAKHLALIFKGGKITRSELILREEQSLAHTGKKLTMLDAKELELLDWQTANQMLLERLLQRQGKMLGKKISADVEVECQRLKQSYDTKAWRKKPQAEGLTETQWRELVVRQVALKYLTKQEIQNTGKINKNRIHQSYQSQHKNEQQEEWLTLRCLVIPVADSDRKQKQELAAKARKRLRAGEDFSKVATGAGAVGSLAAVTVPLKEIRPELVTSVKGLKVGGVGKAVELDGKLMLLQVTAIVPLIQESFEQALPKLREQLERQLENELAHRVMERLRKEADVKFFIPNPSLANSRTS